VCWDNAVAESFFATLKNEMYHRRTFATRARARFAVAEYIEVFYNRREAALHPRLPRSKRSPTTELRRPPQRNQPEDLSTILDTAQVDGGRLVARVATSCCRRKQAPVRSAQRRPAGAGGGLADQAPVNLRAMSLRAARTSNHSSRESRLVA
jgi:hypothetical protein